MLAEITRIVWEACGPDRAEFELLYRERLDRLGVDRARTILAGFAAAFHVAGCVLLCFEDLAKAGEWCHRRTFSAWWEERTGQVVPELVPGQLRLQPVGCETEAVVVSEETATRAPPDAERD